LQNYLGIKEVIWLGEGVSGDDTDGHIDDIARFVDPETIVCAVEEDTADENHAPLKENFDKLCEISRTTDQFRVIPLPMPEPVFADWGRLPASYANFYIANDVVLVPIFGSGRDRKALEILRDLFPHRGVIGIQSAQLVFGMGAIHCLTQQEPKV
jgi:agmatine deiminase